MVKSKFDQLTQVYGSNTYRDDLDIKFAEICGESYDNTVTYTTTSGNNQVTASSAFEGSDVGNYLILNDKAYEVVAVSGTVVTLDTSVDFTGAGVFGDKRENKNLQSDLNYLRSQVQNMSGTDNWNDDVCATLCELSNLIPKEPNHVGDNTQYPGIRSGVATFALNNQNTGYVSDGAPPDEYSDDTSSTSPEVSLTFTDDTDITISIPGGFYPADKGTLTIKKDGVIVASLDLSAAWSNDGCVYETSEADVGNNPDHTSSHTGTDLIDLTDRRCMNQNTDGYDNFWPQHQVASMSATITLDGGYNALIRIEHSDGNGQNNTLSEFWVDTNSHFISANKPTITINTENNRYLSGVPYYNSGTTFDVSISNSDYIFNRGHVHDPCVTHLSAFNDTDKTITLSDLGLNDPPDITDTIGTYNQTPGITVGTSDFRNMDARASVTYNNVFESYTSLDSDAGIFRIDTYSNTSTDTVRYFDDEDYRFVGNENFNDTSINTSDSSWDSTISILTQTDPNGDMGLVVHNGTLKYPTIDHSTFHPVGPDYSGQSGTAVDYELFIASAAFTHGTITFSGWSNALSVIQGLNVEISLRYPNCSNYGNNNTATWQDLAVDQTTYGGNGCLGQGSSGDTVAFSFGTTSSVSYGNRVIMRIRFNDSSVTALTGITFNPTI